MPQIPMSSIAASSSSKKALWLSLHIRRILKATLMNTSQKWQIYSYYCPKHVFPHNNWFTQRTMMETKQQAPTHRMHWLQTAFLGPLKNATNISSLYSMDRIIRFFLKLLPRKPSNIFVMRAFHNTSAHMINVVGEHLSWSAVWKLNQTNSLTAFRISTYKLEEKQKTCISLGSITCFQLHLHFCYVFFY